MKKQFTLLFSVLVFSVSVAMAQTGTITNFRKGYLRLGINILGNSFDESLSPTENVLAGNLGASKGYAFEFGKSYYFNNDDALPFRYGLDWTVLSFSYNKFNWEDHISEDVEYEGGKFAIGLSSKLGPVISINPVEKVIIDARLQIVPQLYFYDFSYYNNSDENDYFSFIDEDPEGMDEDYDPEKVMDRLFFGLKPNFGVTIRRNALGLALDYSPGKIKTQYSSYEGHGTEKLKVSAFQIKLSLTL